MYFLQCLLMNLVRPGIGIHHWIWQVLWCAARSSSRNKELSALPECCQQTVLSPALKAAWTAEGCFSQSHTPSSGTCVQWWISPGVWWSGPLVSIWDSYSGASYPQNSRTVGRSFPIDCITAQLSGVREQASTSSQELVCASNSSVFHTQWY